MFYDRGYKVRFRVKAFEVRDTDGVELMGEMNEEGLGPVVWWSQ